jgi:hypothetical protein
MEDNLPEHTATWKADQWNRIDKVLNRVAVFERSFLKQEDFWSADDTGCAPRGGHARWLEVLPV